MTSGLVAIPAEGHHRHVIVASRTGSEGHEILHAGGHQRLKSQRPGGGAEGHEALAPAIRHPIHSAGDTMLLYTDGVLEAREPAGS